MIYFIIKVKYDKFMNRWIVMKKIQSANYSYTNPIDPGQNGNARKIE
jgi:hypothetical protein